MTTLWLWLTLSFAAPAPTTPTVGPTAEAHDPVDAVMRDGGDPAARLPMIVALHGRGDTAEGFIGALDGFEGARIVVLRAPIPSGDGAAWFEGSVRDLSAAALTRALTAQGDAVVARINAALARWPTVGAPVITGFSQGAMVSWVVAVQRPEVVAAAVPVAGFLPLSLLPPATADQSLVVAPIRALHGEADRMIAIGPDAQAVEAVVALGGDAQLIPFAGVDHAIPPDLRRRWFVELEKALPRVTPGVRGPAK
jgi:phospholipase/carboxylesterase